MISGISGCTTGPAASSSRLGVSQTMRRWRAAIAAASPAKISRVCGFAASAAAALTSGGRCLRSRAGSSASDKSRSEIQADPLAATSSRGKTRSSRARVAATYQRRMRSRSSSAFSASRAASYRAALAPPHSATDRCRLARAARCRPAGRRAARRSCGRGWPRCRPAARTSRRRPRLRRHVGVPPKPCAQAARCE